MGGVGGGLGGGGGGTGRGVVEPTKRLVLTQTFMYTSTQLPNPLVACTAATSIFWLPWSVCLVAQKKRGEEISGRTRLI